MMASFFLKFSILSFLLVAATAQIPAERSENCGSLLSVIISVCSHPTLGRPDWCCNELKKWNDARCWCEPNAFDALDTVAANGFAYSFRDGFCPEAFQRPNRGNIEPQYATCTPFDTVAEGDVTEQCPSVDAAELRAARYASLANLNNDKVASNEDLSSWFGRMDALFTEDAEYENIGIFLGRGRFEVKQYLMTRQDVYGFEPITADMTGDYFWRNPRMVSYNGGATTSLGYFNKREFVTFERCSAKIESVYSLEDNYQNRYKQFWDAAETRLMLRYRQTSEEWCNDVASRCTGDNFPYESVEDCVSFHSELVNNGQVTCNKFEQAYVPQFAIHGNTVACRSFYLDLATVYAEGACPGVGKEPTQERCAASQCPGNAYINPFGRNAEEPQYEFIASFPCTADTCTETWPSAAQIASIPETEIDNFTKTPPTAAPVITDPAMMNAATIPSSTEEADMGTAEGARSTRHLEPAQNQTVGVNQTFVAQNINA